MVQGFNYFKSKGKSPENKITDEEFGKLLLLIISAILSLTKPNY